jgi:hypothetical protein
VYDRLEYFLKISKLITQKTKGENENLKTFPPHETVFCSL